MTLNNRTFLKCLWYELCASKIMQLSQPFSELSYAVVKCRIDILFQDIISSYNISNDDSYLWGRERRTKYCLNGKGENWYFTLIILLSRWKQALSHFFLYWIIFQLNCRFIFWFFPLWPFNLLKGLSKISFYSIKNASGQD